MNKNKLSAVKNLITMESNELQNLKGGLLITCEEKKRAIMGYTFTQTNYTVKNDGKLFITMKM